MGRRRQAREIALQALYIVDTAGVEQGEAFAIVNRLHNPDDGRVLEFSRGLFSGVLAHRAALDERIEAVAENWALARMAAVDRNILRLAAFELLHDPQTPVSVVIDEAIEIARKYSTEDSTRFVNGILDKLKPAPPSGSRPARRGKSKR